MITEKQKADNFWGMYYSSNILCAKSLVGHRCVAASGDADNFIYRTSDTRKAASWCCVYGI